MNKLELLNILKLAKPALADKEVVPIFTHFCFENDVVFAYNDIMGVLFPLESGIEAAVHGDTLMGVLENTKGDEIEMVQKGNGIVIKRGKQKQTELVTLPKDDFIFNEPDTKKAISLAYDAALSKAFDLCVRTASTDTASTAMMGVTLSLDEESFMYSTDMKTISRHAILSGETHKPSEHILPTDFVKTLAKMFETMGEEVTLLLTDEFAMGEFESGAFLFGRLHESDQDLDFAALIDESMDESELAEAYDIPVDLESELKIAQAVIKNDKDTFTNLSIKKNAIVLGASANSGDTGGTLKLKGKHSDIEICVDTELVIRAISMCDKMVINETCVSTLKGDGFFHMIANVSEIQ